MLQRCCSELRLRRVRCHSRSVRPHGSTSINADPKCLHGAYTESKKQKAQSEDWAKYLNSLVGRT